MCMCVFVFVCVCLCVCLCVCVHMYRFPEMSFLWVRCLFVLGAYAIGPIFTHAGAQTSLSNKTLAIRNMAQLCPKWKEANRTRKHLDFFVYLLYFWVLPGSVQELLQALLRNYS